MKTKKRVFIFLAFMLVMMTVLAGCGSSKNESVESQKPATTTTTEPTVAPTNTAPSEPQITGDFEIQYFVGGYGDEWWKNVLAEFQQKYPDLKIKESMGPKINAQMKPRWLQGDPPDVVSLDGADINPDQMIKDDQLMDLSAWVKDAKNVNGEKLLDTFISKPQEVDNKIYSLPFVFGSWGTFYDKALFKKNNWEAPTDYESFLALGDKIKATGMNPYIFTGVYVDYLHSGFLYPAVVSNNGDNIDILNDMRELKAGVFKSEPVLKALNQIAEVRDKGFFDKNSVALNHTETQMLFLQHKDAFIPNGLWLDNEMKKDVPAGFEFGFIPSITQAKGGKYIVYSYTSPIGIAKKAKNPEAAKAFLEFIYTKKAAADWADKTGAIMNVKTDLSATKASDSSKLAMTYFSRNDTVVVSQIGMNPDVSKVMQDATIALVGKKISPEDWADRMEKAADKVRANK